MPPKSLTALEHEHIVHTFSQAIAFNTLLGLEPIRIEGERVVLDFKMRDDLVGHPQRRVLHGGVISSALDVVGGLVAFLGVLRQDATIGEDQAESVLARLATIDMRIDYLRPGQGEMFTASASIVRAGKKVAVSRMTLCNESDVEIALGTATYMVG